MKAMAVGREVTADDRTSLRVGEEDIESMNEFLYLGSHIESSGRVMLAGKKRIAQASKAIGELRKSVLLNQDLNVTTKRKVFQSCVLCGVQHSDP